MTLAIARARTVFMRKRDGRSLLKGAGESCLYVGVGLLMMWPVTLHLGSRFAGWRDAHYYAWLNWRVGEMLRDGSLGLRIPDIIWPYGIDVRLLDGQLPTLIGGLWNVMASPYLAFNLGLLTGTLLNLWAGRRIGRLFSEHRAVWILTAIAFATAPAIAARLEIHFTMYYAFSVALIVEEAVRVARGDRSMNPLRVGALLFLAYLCGIYFLVFGALAFGLIVILSAVSAPGLPRVLLRGVASVGVAIILMTPFLAARLALEREERGHGRDPVLLRRTFVAEADALSIITQPSWSTFELPGAESLRRSIGDTGHESTIFPGFLLLAGFAGLVFLRSPLRWPLLIAALSMWLLALGTSLKVGGAFLFTAGAGGREPVAWLPYTGLLWIPGLGSLRSPDRASFTLAAVLAVPVAMSLGWLFARFVTPWKRTALCGVAGSVLLTNLLIPIHADTTIEGTAVVQRALFEVAARAQPGESMVEVPADCAGQTRTVLFQVLHRTPLVGCQTSPSAIPWRSGLSLYKGSAALAALRCRQRALGPFEKTRFTGEERFGSEDVASLKRDLGVRFLLVDTRRLDTRRCAWVRTALPLIRRFESLGEDDHWLVVDMRSAVAPDGG